MVLNSLSNPNWESSATLCRPRTARIYVDGRVLRLIVKPKPMWYWIFFEFVSERNIYFKTNHIFKETNRKLFLNMKIQKMIWCGLFFFLSAVYMTIQALEVFFSSSSL